MMGMFHPNASRNEKSLIMKASPSKPSLKVRWKMKEEATKKTKRRVKEWTNLECNELNMKVKVRVKRERP